MKKNQAFSDSRLFDAQILGDQVIPGASNDNNRAYSLTLHSGEELLAYGSGKYIIIYKGNKFLQFLGGHENKITAVSWCESRPIIAACSLGRIVIYDAIIQGDKMEWKISHIIDQPNAAFRCLSWNFSGNDLLAGGDECVLFEKKGSKWEPSWREVNPKPVNDICFSSDERFFYSVSENDCYLKLWYKTHIPGLFSYILLRHPQPVVAAEWRKTEFSRKTFNRNCIMTNCKDGVVRIWSETYQNETLRFFISYANKFEKIRIAKWLNRPLEMTTNEQAIAQFTSQETEIPEDAGHYFKVEEFLTPYELKQSQGGKRMLSEEQEIAMMTHKNESFTWISVIKEDGSFDIHLMSGLGDIPRRTPLISNWIQIPEAFKKTNAPQSTFSLFYLVDKNQTRITEQKSNIVNYTPSRIKIISCDADGMILSWELLVKTDNNFLFPELKLLKCFTGHKETVEMFECHPKFPLNCSFSRLEKKLIVWHEQELCLFGKSNSLTNISQMQLDAGSLTWHPKKPIIVASTDEGLQFYKLKIINKAKEPASILSDLSLFSPLSSDCSLVKYNIVSPNEVHRNIDDAIFLKAFTYHFVQKKEQEKIFYLFSVQQDSRDTVLIIWEVTEESKVTMKELAKLRISGKKVTSAHAEKAITYLKMDTSCFLMAIGFEDGTVSIYNFSFREAQMFKKPSKKDKETQQTAPETGHELSEICSFEAETGPVSQIKMTSFLSRIATTTEKSDKVHIWEAESDLNFQLEETICMCPDKKIVCFEWIDFENGKFVLAVGNEEELIGYCQANAYPFDKSSNIDGHWSKLGNFTDQSIANQKGQTLRSICITKENTVLGAFGPTIHLFSKWHVFPELLAKINTASAADAATALTIAETKEFFTKCFFEQSLALHRRLPDYHPRILIDLLLRGSFACIRKTLLNLREECKRYQSVKNEESEWVPYLSVQQIISAKKEDDMNMQREEKEKRQHQTAKQAAVPKMKTILDKFKSSKRDDDDDDDDDDEDDEKEKEKDNKKDKYDDEDDEKNKDDETESETEGESESLSQSYSYSESYNSYSEKEDGGKHRRKKHKSSSGGEKIDEEAEKFALEMQEKMKEVMKNEVANAREFLISFLSKEQLPDLNSLDQMNLLAFLDTFDELQEKPEALDDASVRFYVSYKIFKYLSRTSVGKANFIHSSTMAWALHSETQETLIDMMGIMSPSVNLTWELFVGLGLMFWVNKIQLLKNIVEKMVKDMFKNTKEPTKCCVFYVAMRKVSTFINLLNMTQNDKLAIFFGRDFTQKKNQQAAKVNAFTLLGRHEIDYASGFFLLADSPQDAFDILEKREKNFPLAFLIARLYFGDQTPELLNYIETSMIGYARSQNDVWLESMLLWYQKKYEDAFCLISHSQNEVKKFSYVGFDPSLHDHVKYLATLPQLQQSEAVNYQRNVLLLRTAHYYSQIGMLIFAAENMKRLQFSKPNEESEQKTKAVTPASKPTIQQPPQKTGGSLMSMMRNPMAAAQQASSAQTQAAKSKNILTGELDMSMFGDFGDFGAPKPAPKPVAAPKPAMGGGLLSKFSSNSPNSRTSSSDTTKSVAAAKKSANNQKLAVMLKDLAIFKTCLSVFTQLIVDISKDISRLLEEDFIEVYETTQSSLDEIISYFGLPKVEFLEKVQYFCDKNYFLVAKFLTNNDENIFSNLNSLLKTYSLKISSILHHFINKKLSKSQISNLDRIIKEFFICLRICEKEKISLVEIHAEVAFLLYVLHFFYYLEKKEFELLFFLFSLPQYDNIWKIKKKSESLFYSVVQNPLKFYGELDTMIKKKKEDQRLEQEMESMLNKEIEDKLTSPVSPSTIQKKEKSPVPGAENSSFSSFGEELDKEKGIVEENSDKSSSGNEKKPQKTKEEQEEELALLQAEISKNNKKREGELIFTSLLISSLYSNLKIILKYADEARTAPFQDSPIIMNIMSCCELWIKLFEKRIRKIELETISAASSDVWVSKEIHDQLESIKVSKINMMVNNIFYKLENSHKVSSSTHPEISCHFVKGSKTFLPEQAVDFYMENNFLPLMESFNKK